LSLIRKKREKKEKKKKQRKKKKKEKNKTKHYKLTFPFSTNLQSITIISTLCSQTIRQKSAIVLTFGPWVAMYLFFFLYPWIYDIPN